MRDEAARARVEREEALRDIEAAERARAEAELPRLPAVTVAAGMERAAFSATTCVPPTPHLFVPSGFAATGHDRLRSLASSERSRGSYFDDLDRGITSKPFLPCV